MHEISGKRSIRPWAVISQEIRPYARAFLISLVECRSGEHTFDQVLKKATQYTLEEWAGGFRGSWLTDDMHIRQKRPCVDPQHWAKKFFFSLM